MSLSEREVLVSLRDDGPASIGDLAARFYRPAFEASEPLLSLQGKGHVLFDKAHALGRVWRLTEAGIAATGKASS